MSGDTSKPTMVLSVVAVDLVAYSRKSVAEQVSLKDNFNKILQRAITDIAVADRIILDTGDGVAIGFLGDPEDALYVAMFMHLAINRGKAGTPSGGAGGKDSGNAIRLGINLGPVKLAVGVGGHPNLIGDGINVADRIMRFAEPGQLTASRSFFEVMSRTSGPYTNLFQYAGLRTDDQVRAHDVYLVGKSVLAFQQAEMGVAERAAQRTRKLTSAPAPASLFSGVAPAAPANESAFATVSANPAKAIAPAATLHTTTEHDSALIDFLEDRKKVATTATALGIVATLLFALVGYRKLVAIPGDRAAPAVAAPSDSPTNNRVAPDALPSVPPASVVAAIEAVNAPPSKPPPKPSSPVPTSTPLAASRPATTPVAPAAPSTGAASAKGSERATSPPAAIATKTPEVRDTPKAATSARTDQGDRSDKNSARDEPRNEPRKPQPPRAVADREKAPPVSSAPFVPTYPSPVEVPKPETVAPTPSPTPPPAPVLDTSVVVVSRSAPGYPVEGIRQGITFGAVRARLTIDAAGNVTDVNILETRPIVAFGRESRLTLRQWKFNPGAPGRTYDVELTFKP